MFTPNLSSSKPVQSITKDLIEEQQQNLSKVNRFLLMRFEPHLERAFETFRYHRILKRVPIIGITGLVLFLLFSVLDYFTLPTEVYRISIPIRLLIICPLISLIVYFGVKKVSARLFFGVYFSVYIISGCAICAIIFAADLYGHFLPYDGILLHLVFGYFIMSLPYLMAMYGGLFITCIYLAVSVYMDLPLELLASNSIFIASINFIGAIGSYMQERARRFLFLNENLVALAKAKDKKEIASKTRLVATASHDLRQPLHAMHLLIEALKDQLPDGEQRNMAKSIDVSVKQLSHLLGTLLDISKLNAGIVEPKLEPLKLKTKIVSFLREQAIRAKAENIELNYEGDEDIYVSVDPMLLDRMIRNVIENIFVHAQASQIDIFWRKEEDQVLLEIKDNGKGISEMDLDSIFDEFHQAGDQTQSGMGLGLAIVKQLAELQGIQYGLKSESGKGASFWFRLPSSNLKAEAQDEFLIPLTIFNKQDSVFIKHWVGSIETWGYKANLLPIGAHMPSEHIARMLPRNTKILVWDAFGSDNLKEIQRQIKEVRMIFKTTLPILLVVEDDRLNDCEHFNEEDSDITVIVSGKVRPGKLRLMLNHLAAQL